MASLAYSEQVGWKRQRGPRKGDTQSWYARISPMAIAFTSDTQTFYGPLADFVDHGMQAVAAGRAQVPVKPGPGDEVGRRFEYLGRAPSAVNAHKDRRQSGNDRGVADRKKEKAPFVLPGLQPHLGLAAAQAVVLDPPLVGKVGRIAAQFDDVLVALHPAVEEAQFFEQLLLGVPQTSGGRRFDAHNRVGFSCPA